jgi:prevent-host-death family protein
MGTERERAIPAAVFKARCLKLIDEVAERRIEIMVTRRGKPLAKLVPIGDGAPSLFGALRGTVTIRGDIISPPENEWEADR